MSKIKGGRAVTRQNFSMHPDLMKAIMESSNVLSVQRSEEILDDRSTRVTYSKVVAALVFDAIQSGLIRQDGKRFLPTEKFVALIRNYEASFYADETVKRQRRRPSVPKGEREAFRRDCEIYGLNAGDYRRPFLWQGRRVGATGFDAANAAAPVLARDEESGEQFLLSLADFNSAPWAPEETASAVSKKEVQINDEESTQE